MCYLSVLTLDSFLLKVDKVINSLHFHNCILTVLYCTDDE